MSHWLARLLGLLLMASALAVALSRAPDRPVESLVARWAPPPSDFIEVRGQVVHLRDEGPRGDPEPIVLLHGTGASLHTWEGWAAALRRTRRVVTVDLPGFGLTGPFAGAYAPEDYRGDSYARFVLDMLDALKIPRAVLGGNSLGGEIAWRTAALAPQRVTRLVLVGATGYEFAPEHLPPGFLLAWTPVLGRVGEYLTPRALVAASVAAVYGDPARVTEALVDRYFELTLREGNRRALGLRLRQMEAGAHAARIATLTQPTLVLWGGRDRLVPPAIGLRFAAAIRGAQRVQFDDLGHVPQEEDPARTVQPVLAFLDAASAPR
ncbi:MAG TPA: alpha/beta hydrolase [Burkholderiaceae bacterium]|nr:alpha/beta hydrolase [Burkholderiaceae bacterium]